MQRKRRKQRFLGAFQGLDFGFCLKGPNPAGPGRPAVFHSRNGSPAVVCHVNATAGKVKTGNTEGTEDINLRERRNSF